VLIRFFTLPKVDVHPLKTTDLPQNGDPNGSSARSLESEPSNVDTDSKYRNKEN
jgi:hypothetical protein